MNKKVIIAVVAVIVLAAVGAWLYMYMKPATTQTSNVSTATASATITYTDKGFDPSTVTVKTGDSIKLVNNSSLSLKFSSDDHPTHLKDPELNLSDLSPGATTTFNVTQTGSNGYHNHNQPSDTGIIVVN